MGLWSVSAVMDALRLSKQRRNGAVKLRTFKYSSEASCHSFVIVRGRMGLANMRVKAKIAKAPAMTADERRKTLRPSSGGGGRRGPWGPKAMK